MPASDDVRVERARATFDLLEGSMELHGIRRNERDVKHGLLVARTQTRIGVSTADLRAEIDRLTEELEKAHERIAELEERNYIDPLTGVLNRAGLDQTLTNEWNRSANAGQSLGVIFIDLDHFKWINDTFDHSVGDAALTAIGAQLIRCLRRSGEVACRYGGDEFVAIVPNTTDQDTATLAERIRQSIAAIQLPVGDKVVRLKTSIGFAVSTPHTDANGPTALLQQADAALKEAKQNGRDQCVMLVDGTVLVARSQNNETPNRGARR